MIKNSIITLAFLLCTAAGLKAQEIIPLDTAHWSIRTTSYLNENYKGKDAIYLKGGNMLLKDTRFRNGTIEFDIYLKEVQAFPGLYFRATGYDAEQFFLRPHLSGKADANQAAPTTNGITAFQFYFGPRYSFPYEYKYDDWTHVKLVVNEDRAQVFLDYSEKPNLSWNLFHEARAGAIVLQGGGLEAMHLANFSIDPDATEIVDFNPIEREPLEGIVSKWQISDKFDEKLLNDPNTFKKLIADRKWPHEVEIEEGVAANIARKVLLRDGTSTNTVMAKITINSDKKQIKRFHFGYSDRVVAMLNGEAIYWGNNKWRSRDYRYLGTIGLFDAVYLNLKKGENTLIFAVSEDFGGWLITGKFDDPSGVEVK